jgi:hypothetical protein
MKRLTAILCFLTLAWNTALGSIGGILFCEHDGGNEHWISKVAHGQEAHEECSHPNETSPSEGVLFRTDCNSCTDIEIEAKDLDAVLKKFDRSGLKAPLVIAWAAITQAITFPEVRFARELQSPRVPNIVRNATLQFTDTVQFLC